MILSASSLWLVGTLLGVSDTVPPSAAAQQVRASLAARWSVSESSVVLAWGQWPTDTTRFQHAKAQFPGTPDRQGWLAVVFTPDSGSPVSVRLRAGILAPVLVAARSLEPGHLLIPGDLLLSQAIQWGGGQPMPPIDRTGWEVRRPTKAGDALLATNTVAPIGIKAGETVRLLWERGQVRIEIEAVAMGQARIGEVVRARKGDIQYTGTLTAPGIARLGGSSS